MTRVTVDVPDVPYPGGHSTADFMREAARHLRDGYGVGGSNVRATVAALLTLVADQLEHPLPPVPALDLGHPAGLTWEARLIKPGTQWADEPTEITPGWWVIGSAPEAEEDGASVLLYVESAIDSDGAVATQRVAQSLATHLTGGQS